MATINVVGVLEEIGKVSIEISADEAELTAGQDVALPVVQIGTSGGKPIYLKGTLTENPS